MTLHACDRCQKVMNEKPIRLELRNSQWFGWSGLTLELCSVCSKWLMDEIPAIAEKIKETARLKEEREKKRAERDAEQKEREEKS